MPPQHIPTIMPSKKLTITRIFDFSPLMQKIIMVLLSKEEASSEMIADEIRIPIHEVKTVIEKLVKLGFIGQKGTNGNILYFCVV